MSRDKWRLTIGDVSGNAIEPESLQGSVPRGAQGLVSRGTAVRRHTFFALLCIFSGIVFLGPLRALVLLALHSDYYSHTVVMPLLAGCLVYWNRRRIFVEDRLGLLSGLTLMSASALLFVLQQWGMSRTSQQGRLSWAILSIVLFWIGGFALCYGRRAFRATLFPLLLLLLMIPFPITAMDDFIYLTRLGSADVASAVFSAVGVPVFREGFQFILPGVSIEIAKECSGIHSTIALFVLSIIAGHLFLRRPWKRTLLLLFVFPIVSLTNGLRIATLTLIAQYVDKNIFNTSFHRNGGIFFFLVAFGLIVMILRFFREQKGIAPADGAGMAFGSGTADRRA
jgi:exosortase